MEIFYILKFIFLALHFKIPLFIYIYIYIEIDNIKNLRGCLVLIFKNNFLCKV